MGARADRQPRTLSVGGASYPCRAHMGAYRRYKRLTGSDVSTLSEGDLDGMVTFVYCCVASACNADGVPFDLDLDTFADHLSVEAVNAFFEGMAAEAGKKATAPR